MRNFYFICASSYDNLGDLIINKMLIDELCKYGRVYVDAYHVPEHFSKYLLENPNTVDVYSNYRVSAKRISLSNLFNFFTFLRSKKVRLITRSPGPIIEPNAKIRMGFRIINCLARFAGSRITYFGNCCSAQLSRDEALKSNGVQNVFMRSIASVEYAKKYFKNVDYIPDMAFLLHTYKNNSVKKTVLVDYRPSENDNAESIQELQSLVSQFKEYGYEIELYYQVVSDKEHSQFLFNDLGNEYITFRSDTLWYDDLDFYKGKSFVISNRLHSLLIGAAFGVIPIARISSDHKMLKIKHVFQSSFSSTLNSWCGIESKIDIPSLVKNESIIRDTLSKEMRHNHILCEEVIRKHVANV